METIFHIKDRNMSEDFLHFFELIMRSQNANIKITATAAVNP